VTIEHIFGITTWGQLAFDPTRPRLYFSESCADKQKNRMNHRIMMMEVGGRNGSVGLSGSSGLNGSSQSPIALTAGPSDLRPSPSPDGAWLAFLSRRSGSAQVWRLPLQGGEPTQVTFLQGGVKNFSWAPDSLGLVVVAHIKDGLLEREKTEAQPTAAAADAELETYYNRDVRHITHQYYKLDGEGFFDQGRDQLVSVTLAGSTELLTSGVDNYADPVFSPDGGSLYCLHRAYDPEGSHPGISRVEQLSLETREWTQLPLPEGAIGGLQVSPDGQHLAFYASNPQDYGYGLTTLYRWDLSEGVLTDLSSHLDRSVGDESSSDVPANSTAKPTWRDGQVHMLFSDEGRVSLTVFDNGQVTRFWDEKRVVYDFAMGGDDVALAVSDPTHPSGIILARWGDADASVAWAPVPWSTDNEPVAPEELWATESDGTRVHTWCLRPRAVGAALSDSGESSLHAGTAGAVSSTSGESGATAGTTGLYPTVLEIHGGPMAMYGYRYFHEFQCLVRAGYAVVYTNPRGSQGYGKHFCDAIIGQWGDKDYRDVMAGLDAALSNWSDLDGERLGTAGGSYGGFMVNWIVSHSERFKAAVTMRSVVNRFSAMGSSDMGWLRIPQYGSKPWWEEPESYWQQSPLKYASNIHTPLLIEHQEHDYRLPVEQGEQLYSALKYLGRPVEMVIYPNESHGMSRIGQPWHRIHRLRTIVGWFDRYLKS